MSTDKPLFDPATHYRIELQGRMDMEWLRNFVSPAQISVNETSQGERISALSVHTDQAGMVGLVRRLHAMGMTIVLLAVVRDEEEGA